MANNMAAYLDGKGKLLRVGHAPIPEAEPGRVVIRNRSIAINPVDWKIQEEPGFIQNFPIVLGEDVAGDVVEVGEGVTKISRGDRVIAHLDILATQKIEHGGFALYSSAPVATTAVIPDNVSYEEASVIPTAFDTAAVGLFSPISEGYLGLGKPSGNTRASGTTVVVWGGSSSVGALAIQLAVAGGAKVIATASPHNFDFCIACGASEVISYRGSNVVSEVVTAVKRVGGKFSGIYDAISLETESYKCVLPILEELGGGNLATVLPKPQTLPANVCCGQIFCISPLTHSLWKEYVTVALRSGQVKCLPPPISVGEGLESCQAGLDENKRGVSAQKVTITLPSRATSDWV